MTAHSGQWRILLLDPPFFRFLSEDQRSVPLGPAYLAGALRAAGFEDVVLYNADFDPRRKQSVCNRGYFEEMSRFDAYLKAVTDERHPLYREVVDTVAAARPDFVGITLRTAKFFIAKTLIRLLKDALGDVPIVVGGPHATANPDHVLERTQADAVVRGEGEETIVELVRALSAGRTPAGIAGVSWRRGHSIVHEPGRPFVPELDRLALPARDRILHAETLSPDDFGNILSSRGCPFACAFCDSRTTWTRRVRRHSPARVADEIEAIRAAHGTTFFSFQDDCLSTSHSRIGALCDEFERRGLAALPRAEFRWWCEIHPTVVTAEVVARMKAAGCVAMAIGAESGSQRTLDAIDKSSSPDVVRRAARLIREAGLSLSVFFMIGFPWETEADIEETLTFMEELAPDNPTVSVLTPLPGTPIYRYCEQHGLIDHQKVLASDFLTLFHQRSEHFFSETIDDERSRAIIHDALTRRERLAGARRQAHLARVFAERVTPALDRAGLRLRLATDADEDGWDQLEDAVPVSVDQVYQEERIDVRVHDRAAAAGLTADAVARLGAALLRAFPQYATVVVAAADDSAPLWQVGSDGRAVSLARAAAPSGDPAAPAAEG